MGVKGEPATPLRWRVGVRLPTLGRGFDVRRLVWPNARTPIVRAEPVSFETLAAWGQAPELVFVEVDDEAELDALASLVGSQVRAALAVVPASDTFHRLAAALVWRVPGLRIVAREARDDLTLARCAFETEALVRQAALQAILARLRGEEAALVRSLDTLAGGRWVEPKAPPPVRSAALESVLSAHVRATCGVWWTRVPKAAARLLTAPQTVRRYAGLPVLRPHEDAVRPPRRIRCWVVGELPSLPGALRQAFASLAATDVDLVLIPSGEEALRRAEIERVPDLAFVSRRLGARVDGLDLVRQWTSAPTPSVVIGIGAPLAALDGPAFFAAGAWQVLAGETAADGGIAMTVLVSQALQVAAGLGRLVHLRRAIADVMGALLVPPLVPGRPLDEVRDAYLSTVIAGATHRRAAAAALGLHPRTLRRRMRVG